MKPINNTEMTELELREMDHINGGDSSDAFTVYAEYVDMLYAKYNCKSKGGIRCLKTQCTPEERARLIELWHAFLNAEDVAA